MPELDVARVIQVAMANARRARETVARLQRKGLFEEFLKSDAGKAWVSALRSLEDGARDSFAFARGYELDLEESAEAKEIEVGEMPEEIAQLEAEEFEEAERLLGWVEKGGGS